MANEHHLMLLHQGVEAWNQWRRLNFQKWMDLSDTNLSDAYLSGIELRKTDLSNAYMVGADLSEADLHGSIFSQASLKSANLCSAELSGTLLNGTDLSESNLTNANLSNAILHDADASRASFLHADLRNTDLINADLTNTIFIKAQLDGADFTGALLYETTLISLDLSKVQGLNECKHFGPSMIDYRTLSCSGSLPESFLKGIGLADTFIDYIPSLFNQPIQFYSCFISYSQQDEEFAKRLHADLQDKGVRCWYAPEDLPIGAKIRAGIDQAIRKHDKLLLILSEHSVNSQWVESEVESALEKERESGKLVLFPVRIDDAVMESSDGWAGLIKRSRNIGNFCYWKEYDAYQSVFDRLVKDLKRSLAEKD